MLRVRFIIYGQVGIIKIFNLGGEGRELVYDCFIFYFWICVDFVQYVVEDILIRVVMYVIYRIIKIKFKNFFFNI